MLQCVGSDYNNSVTSNRKKPPPVSSAMLQGLGLFAAMQGAGGGRGRWEYKNLQPETGRPPRLGAGLSWPVK